MISQVESGKSILERAKELFATAGDTVNQAIDRVTATTQSAASSLADKTIAPIASTQKSLLQSWLESHPTMERALQIFNWAVNHPIVGTIILLFSIAIAWSLIKSLGRLLENFWLSVLQIPLKLGYFLIQVSWRSLHKLAPRLMQKFPQTQANRMQILPASATQINTHNGSQRLLEISARLAVLNQEQNELIREALAILGSTQIDAENVPHFDF
jgi:hypothetical protein